MLNIEADEAGKLRAFREKFGRGWDASRLEERDEEEGKEGGGGEGEGREPEEREDNLMDLISGYGLEAEGTAKAMGVREGKEKSGKRKGGER